MPVPFYFNHEMAIEMAGCRRGPGADRRALSARPRTRSVRAITPRTRAIVTVSPNNPSGAVLSGASLRELSELCRERGLYHISDETYEYFTYGAARHVSPASFPDATPSHDRDVLAVEGVRLRRLADRLRRLSGAPGGGDDEEPGHHPDLPADRLAGRGAGGAGGRTHATASRTSASWRRSARSSIDQLSAAGAARARARRRRCLLLPDEGGDGRRIRSRWTNG